MVSAKVCGIRAWEEAGAALGFLVGPTHTPASVADAAKRGAAAPEVAA